METEMSNTKCGRFWITENTSRMWVSGSYGNIVALCQSIGKSVHTIRPKQLGSGYQIMVKLKKHKALIHEYVKK